MAKVLLIDDDVLILNVLADMLTRAGFETSSYSRPLEALAAVETERPDVIISDYLMAEMNGIAFLELSVPRSPESARFLCSPHADSDVVMQAVNAGQVTRIIPKPPRELDLIAAVSQAAETVELRR